MFLDSEKSWKNERLERKIVTWEEYFNKEPLSKVIRKIVSEGFKKEH